jgi:hypothetical protein
VVRFVPYPVVGGFLAGTGWLLAKGGFGVASCIRPSMGTLDELLALDALARWTPAVVFAVVLLAIAQVMKWPLLVPAALGVGLVLFFAGMMVVSGSSIADAEAGGWLLGPFPRSRSLAALGGAGAHRRGLGRRARRKQPVSRRSAVVEASAASSIAPVGGIPEPPLDVRVQVRAVPTARVGRSRDVARFASSRHAVFVPRLAEYRFGHLVVDDEEFVHDVIVLPDRVVPDWWRVDGHSLCEQDLAEVLDELPAHLIVGTGHDGGMRPRAEMLVALRARDITVEVLPTIEAVRRYAELDPATTAAALHLTC